jgi:integrase
LQSITILYERDIDIKTAQLWLGHSTFKMTMDIYTHLSKGKEQRSVEKLNGFLGSSE